MRRKGLVLSVITALLMLGGCSEVTNTTAESVSATIVSTHHTALWLQPTKVGKVTTTVTHPETWRTTIKYDEKEYTFKGEDTYNMCDGSEGKEVDCTLTTYYYDNDTQSKDITSINHLN